MMINLFDWIEIMLLTLLCCYVIVQKSSPHVAQHDIKQKWNSEISNFKGAES